MGSVLWEKWGMPTHLNACMTLKGEESSPRDAKLGFRKRIPWNFNGGTPWRASQLWFQGAARRRNQSLWQDDRSVLIPFASSVREADDCGRGGGEVGTGGWEADSNLSWCSIFPHYSLAYQIGRENWGSRKGSRKGRQSRQRSITRSEILPTLPHKMQTLRWTQTRTEAEHLLTRHGLGPHCRICCRGWGKWLQKVSQHVRGQFWNHASLRWIQAISLTSCVTRAKYLTSPAPQFP